MFRSGRKTEMSMIYAGILLLLLVYYAVLGVVWLPQKLVAELETWKPSGYPKKKKVKKQTQEY